MKVQTIKAWWVIVAFVSGFALSMWAEELMLSWRDQYLEFSAPRLHFLSGQPLDRLHNAAQVPFDFKITMWTGTRTHLFRQMADRFLVSYDVWEEKFSVTKTQPPMRTQAHLDAAAAEQWCWKQMPFDKSGLDEKEQFWTRVEIRAQDVKDSGRIFGKQNISDSGISLNGLIELFSRPPAAAQTHWTLEAGPYTLDELKHAQRRGS